MKKRSFFSVVTAQGYFFKRYALIFALIFAGRMLFAQEILLQEGEEEVQTGMFIFPFAFQSDTIGTAVGVSIAGRGWPQETALTYISLVQSFEDTTYLYLRSKDLEIPYTERFFADIDLALGRYNQINTYVNGNSRYSNETAGNNDSSQENYIEGDGYDNKIKFELQYVTPWGHGRENTKSKVWLRDGIVVKGGREPTFWNPAKSGTTSFLFSPFYRKQNVESQELGDDERTAAGVEFAIRYDNTDFSENPTYGSMQQLRLTRDQGWFDSTAEWTTWDFEWAKYFDLGSGGGARQRVIALDFWVTDTLTWNDSVNEGSDLHRPPSYAGATLGGTERMRGFPQNRFYDRSAIYYTVEYRHTLDWNPLTGNSVLRFLKIKVDWIQLVGFAEVGRVAPTFDVDELHSDMKSDAGVSLRFFANNLIMRMDLAASDEDTIFNMMVSHPF